MSRVLHQREKKLSQARKYVGDSGSALRRVRSGRGNGRNRGCGTRSRCLEPKIKAERMSKAPKPPILTVAHAEDETAP